MPSFYNLTSGATAQAQDVQQIIDALKGTVGLGIPLSPTAVNDSVNFAVAVKNTETTNSRALQVLRANNNVLLQADANGVIVSPDGGAATAQVVNLSATQTLTNKTLTTPHLTTAVVDSGGLTVTAGGLTVSAGGATITAGGLTVTAGGVTLGDSTPVTLGTTNPASGANTDLRLRNSRYIGFRNAANSGDNLIGYDSGDTLVLTGVFTSTTVGAAGGASALPASPITYMRVTLGGTTYKIPLYVNA